MIKQKFMVVENGYIYFYINYAKAYSVVWILVLTYSFYYFTQSMFFPHGDILFLFSFKMFKFIGGILVYLSIFRILLTIQKSYPIKALSVALTLNFLGGLYYVSKF